ncbi:hypothetical protein ACWOAQ_06150 [Helcococcus kunzii]|uniref:hypothetical protein n=1 Tax=Helcococcus kunzii TaxID=40091 RepID=UPI001C94F953|nr:hypothetical protein [Helcococcus kunzii]QZO76004.1 hypothetical protein HIF96_06875 [Helcococcus kunzii]
MKRKFYRVACFAISLFFLVLLGFMTKYDVYAESNVVLKLEDFEADAFGQKDSGVAIQKALEKAKALSDEGKSVTLMFEKDGLYRVTKENALEREVHTSNTDSVDFPVKKIGVLVEGIKNLTIEGNNSHIVFEGDMMYLGIFQSENIKVNNLSWDVKVASTTEMSIFNVNEAGNEVDFLFRRHSHIRWKIGG